MHAKNYELYLPPANFGDTKFSWNDMKQIKDISGITYEMFMLDMLAILDNEGIQQVKQAGLPVPTHISNAVSPVVVN